MFRRSSFNYFWQHLLDVRCQLGFNLASCFIKKRFRTWLKGGLHHENNELWNMSGGRLACALLKQERTARAQILKMAVRARVSNVKKWFELVSIAGFPTTQTGYGTTPVGRRGGSRYVERCWDFPYLKINNFQSVNVNVYFYLSLPVSRLFGFYFWWLFALRMLVFCILGCWLLYPFQSVGTYASISNL